MPSSSQIFSYFNLYLNQLVASKNALPLSLFLKFSLVSTRYKITAEPNSKSPQEAEELGVYRRDWLNEMQREEKGEMVFLSPPLPSSLSIIATSRSPLLLPGASLACLYLLREVGGTISNGSRWIMAPDEVLM